MVQNSLILYVKRMIPSLLVMGLITYGIKEGNPMIQYGSIALILVGQLVYQSFKVMRSKPDIEANMSEARRVARRKHLLAVTRSEIEKAKERGKGVRGVSSTMYLLLILPLVIFLATGYILGIIFPGIPSWQTYLVGFIFTMPVSMAISVRSGLGSPMPTASPSTYYINEKGIVFEHMGRFYILHYPLVKMDVKEESNCLEVEGQPTEASIIPSKVRLFSRDVRKLQKILKRFMEK